MKQYQQYGYTQQTVPSPVLSLVPYFDNKRLIIQTSGSKPTDIKQKKLYNERTHNVSNFFLKNYWRNKFKIPEVKKE